MRSYNQFQTDLWRGHFNRLVLSVGPAAIAVPRPTVVVVIGVAVLPVVLLTLVPLNLGR